jgi:hypothetical protein
MSKIVSQSALILILLLAFALQLYAIERQDIWGDEAFSIWLSQQPFSEIVKGGADTHPPGYPLALALWMRAAGTRPLATRALSAFAALLVVPITFALGSQIYGRGTGLKSALLCTVSPMLVYYAQETRMYTLVTAMTAASFYWALRLSQRKASVRTWATYIVFALAAIYTHYYAFYVIIAENLVVLILWLRKRNVRRLASWFGAQALLGLAYVPWIMAQTQFLSGKASSRVSEWHLSTAIEIAQQTLTDFSAGLAVPPEKAQPMLVAFTTLVVLGAVSSLRSRQQQTLAPLLFLTVPGVFAWAVNPIMPFFFSRYLLLIIPAFYLLAAEGLCLLREYHTVVMGLGLLSLLLDHGYGLYGYYTDERFVKGQYSQMMTYVEQHALPEDVLLLANPLQKRIFEYYRLENIETHFVIEVTIPEIAERHERVWLVRFGNPAVYDPNGDLNRWLSTHGSKAHTSDWTDANLSLYVMQSPAGERPQHPLEARLGNHIFLEGYSLGSELLSPGGTLILTLYWKTDAPIDQRYTVFTHLMGPNGQLQAQRDSEPQGGSLSTDQWSVDKRILDNYAITLPENAPPGSYRLNVGMYLLATGERLTVHAASTTTAQDYVTLQTIDVQQP